MCKYITFSDSAGAQCRHGPKTLTSVLKRPHNKTQNDREKSCYDIEIGHKMLVQMKLKDLILKGDKRA